MKLDNVVIMCGCGSLMNLSRECASIRRGIKCYLHRCPDCAKVQCVRVNRWGHIVPEKNVKLRQVVVPVEEKQSDS
jgi:hypothetical protein